MFVSVCIHAYVCMQGRPAEDARGVREQPGDGRPVEHKQTAGGERAEARPTSAGDAEI